MIRPITSEFKRLRTEFNDSRDTMITLDEDDSEPTGASTGKKYFLEPPPSWMKQKDAVEKQLGDIRKDSTLHCLYPPNGCSGQIGGDAHCPPKLLIRLAV
jgi:hypothetical protein